MTKTTLTDALTIKKSIVFVLPFEILEQIIDYLNPLDIVECICVSSEWKNRFYPVLFRSIKLANGLEYDDLFENLQKSATQHQKSIKKDDVPASDSAINKNNAHLHSNSISERKLGCHTRHLKLHDSFMTTQRMDELAAYCPNLSSIVTHWRISGDRGGRALLSKKLITPEEKASRGSLTSYTSIFIPLLYRLLSPVTLSLPGGSNNNNLVSLTLTMRNIKQSYIDPFFEGPAMSAFFSILRLVPRLEYLVLDIIELHISLMDMEEIHKLCPQLKHLEILRSILVTDKTSSVSTSSSSLNNQGQQELRPAYNIKTLALIFSLWSDDVYIYNNPWFLYIQRKYPNVKRLSIQSKEVRTGFTRFAGHRQVPRQTTSEKKELSTIKLKTYFPSLEHLDIGRFADKPSTAWPHLVQGIPSITLHDDGTKFFETWMKTIAEDNTLKQLDANDSTTKDSTLRRLTVGCIPKNLDGFSFCGHLIQQLCLNGESFLHVRSYQELPVNILLSSCPAMQYLKINHYIISYIIDNNDGDIDRTPDGSSLLKTLIIEDSFIMDNNVLTYVGKQCPQLDHLDLMRCSWCSKGRAHPIIRINMANHWFKYFRIIKPNTYTDQKAGFRLGNENHQPWIDINPELSYFDYFLVKRQKNENNMATTSSSSILPQQVDSALLFDVSATSDIPNSPHCIKRLIDGDVVSWLEKDVTTGLEQTKEEERDICGRYYIFKRYSSIILYCSDVGQLYYDTAQLDKEYISYNSRAIPKTQSG